MRLRSEGGELEQGGALGKGDLGMAVALMIFGKAFSVGQLASVT